MKSRKIISLVLVLLVSSVALYFYRASSNNAVSNTSPNTISVADSVKDKIPFVNKHEEMRRAADAINTRIDFWGKVIDQNGDPILGATISATVREWEMGGFLRANGKFNEYQLVSNEEGMFSLQNARGDSLSFKSVSKNGFQVLPFSFTYTYDRSSYSHQPDSNNPVIIRMIEKDLVENVQLRQFRIKRRIRTDGTPLVLDVWTSVHGEGADAAGDLVLSFHRTPRLITTGAKNYNWDLDVRVKNGGLIITNESFDFLWQAPLSGYQEHYFISVQRDDPNWIPELKLNFYFKLDGKNWFGKATVDLQAGYSEERTGIGIEGVINPSGSRILKSL